MKTKNEVIEWMRDKGIHNKFIRNMNRCHHNLTLDTLLSDWRQEDILMFAFSWTLCNNEFNDDTNWCVLSNEYIKWYESV